MSDIVERLRALARYEHSDASVGDEAADEIERLRAAQQERDKPVGKVVAAVIGANDVAMIEWTSEYRPTVGDLIYANLPVRALIGDERE